jgi:hypothetical protein
VQRETGMAPQARWEAGGKPVASYRTCRSRSSTWMCCC